MASLMPRGRTAEDDEEDHGGVVRDNVEELATVPQGGSVRSERRPAGRAGYGRTAAAGCVAADRPAW